MTKIIIEAVSIFSKLLAARGVIHNNYKNKACFHFWMVSNALSLAVHLYARLWSMAAGDAAFFALAVHGLIMWSRKSKN